jgi:hypothetical protein
MLRVEDTLVPLMCMSDGTHLPNFAGHRNEWPVYIAIGNLSSTIRKMPSTHSIEMVALLLIPMKNRNTPQKRLDELRQPNRERLNEVLPQVLQPLTLEQHPSTESGHLHILYADANFRRYQLVLAAWLADYPENSDRHHLERHRCLWSECPKNQLL